MKSADVVLGTVVAVSLASVALAGSSSAVMLDLYDSVVDEQDTNAFYGRSGFCSGSSTAIQAGAFTGDQQRPGPSSAYDVEGPWTLSTGLTSTAYLNGTDCGSTCVRAQLGSKNKTLSFDSRGTPRTLAVSFAEPCGSAEGCQGPSGDPAVFGGSIATPLLLNVFLDSPFTAMQVCSSTACPEAQPAFAKAWFADPAQADATWRIDWQYLRVLRVAPGAWYVVADACDGTQIAGLSKLTGQRTRPKTVLNGYYRIPFFLAVIQ